MASPSTDAAAVSNNNVVLDIPRDCIACDNRPSCGKTGPQKRCTRCKAVFYCSVECQKKHWKQHKRSCCPLDESLVKLRQNGDGFFGGKLYYSQEDVALIDTVDFSNKQECSICLTNSIVCPILVKTCRHVFCASCLYQWQDKTKEQQSSSSSNPSFLVANIYSNQPARKVVLGDVPTHCPTCRGEAGRKNVVHVLVAKSQHALEMAKKKENGKKEEEGGPNHLDQVLSDMDAVLVKSKDRPDDYAIYATKAQILLFLQKPQEALACLVEFGEANSDWKETTVEGMGMTLLEAQAYMQLEQWDKALARCQPAPCVPLAFSTMRLMNMFKAQCHYHLQQYEQAIRAIDWILEMPHHSKDRHYPGVHKYKALSEKAMGDLDAAIRTMNRAVLYETPWESAGCCGESSLEGETALDLYQQLLAEKK